MSGARLIGISARFEGHGPVTGFDMSGLVRRLLLFDGYVLESIRLSEFRFFGEHLGYARSRDLLQSGLIEIRNEVMQPAEMLNSPQPTLQYRFSWIDYHDLRKTTSDNLAELRDIGGMSHKENVKFRRLIAERIRPLPAEHRLEVAAAFHREVADRFMVRESLRIALHRLGITAPTDFVAEFEVVTENDIFRLHTDLVRVHKLDPTLVHKAGQQALIAVGSLCQQICEMQYYRAISGFTDQETPLYSLKLGQFLAGQTRSENHEREFKRVLEIARLPSYDYSRPVDVDRLLKVRDDQNTAIFRDWLANNDSRSDEEIRDLLTGFRSNLSLVLEDPSTTAMRFLVTSSLGMLPKGGGLLGPAASLLDCILGSVVPKAGVAGFVHRSYPSLFK